MAAGAVPALAAVLEAHAGVAGAAQYACLALATISATSAGSRAGMSIGAMPHIAAALKLHAGEAGVAEAAALALSGVIKGSSSGALACKEAGAIPSLITALQAHAGSAAASERLCRVLLTVHHLIDDVDSRVDAARALAAVLQQQGSVARVEELALWTLYTLTDCFLRTGTGGTVCMDSGIMPLVVASLRARGSNAKVAESACFILMLCAAVRPAAVIAEGAVPLLVTLALSKHPTVRNANVAVTALSYLGLTKNGMRI